MATGRSWTLDLCLALAAIAPSGCAGPNPFTSRQTTVGSLKASVSQLEFENEKLKKDVGELKVDNSRLDNQLVQEREANGEIAARLDDAKDLLRRGGTAQASLGTPSRNFEDDDIPPPVATPKGRRVRNSRPSPAVAIPRPASPRINDDDLSYFNTGRGSRDLDRDLGSPSRSDDDRWLPVARGLPSRIRQ